MHRATKVTHIVNKAMLIQFINDKCLIKKQKSYKTAYLLITDAFHVTQILICTSVNTCLWWTVMRCDRTIYFVVSEYSTKHYYLEDCLVFANLFLSMYVCMICITLVRRNGLDEFAKFKLTIN